jgi:hypothetical protein
MKPIQLHPFSLLAGATVAVLAFVAMGQQIVPNHGAHGDRLVREPQFMVHPRDWVQIEEAVPYVVPPGKVFALTGLGSAVNGLSTSVELRIDGGRVLDARATTASDNDVTTMRPIPRGLSARAGATVDVSDNAGGAFARAWGYLADA